MIILVSVVAQIGPKGSCAVHMNRPQPATSVGYSIYLKKNYKRGAISLAARSGLALLLGYTKSCGPVGDLFCSKVFTNDLPVQNVKQLVFLFC